MFFTLHKSNKNAFCHSFNTDKNVSLLINFNEVNLLNIYTL